MNETRQQRRRAERTATKRPGSSGPDPDLSARSGKLKRRAALLLVIGALLQFTALMVDSEAGETFGEARDAVYYGMVGLGFILIVVAGAMLGRGFGFGKPKGR